MRRSAGVAHVAWWVGARWWVVVIALHVVIVGWAVPRAATEQVAGHPSAAEPSPAEPAALVADAFAAGVVTPREADEGLWLSWSLVDTVRDRRVGSANSGTERPNSESSIKAWIAADYLFGRRTRYRPADDDDVQCDHDHPPPGTHPPGDVRDAG